MSLPGYRSLQPLPSTRAFEAFAGFSEEWQRDVRVYVARPIADPALQQRFIETVREAALCQHVALEKTLGVTRFSDGRWSVAVEPIDGVRLLDQVTRHGPLSADDAAMLITNLCAGLAHAHVSGLTHGGIGLHSVALEGGLQRLAPKLCGLGTGLLDGSPPGFSAPEARPGQPTIAQDIYALGAVLLASVTDVLPTASSARPPLPESAKHLDAVITRCLEVDPRRRFASVTDVARALSRADGTLVSSPGLKAQPIALLATGPQEIVGPPEAGENGTGHMLGPYRLVSLLGEGSMGRVFLGQHTLLGRQVAIKVLRPDQYKQADLVQRFFQEARTVNQINHEHIVEIIDFVSEPGPSGPSLVYCVMELLKGETLAGVVADGPILLARTLTIVPQICEALAAAHRVGVVHRDVKPDNIFLIERGGQRDYVKVLDFGVAKLTTAHADAPLISTMDGAIIGTPICMAPEQAAGQSVDARADVYAVGVILYLMISGRLPFDAKNFGALAAQIITQPPPPLGDLSASGEVLTPALNNLVMRCLEKDPARRPQSMIELRGLLLAPPDVTPIAPTAVIAPAKIELAPPPKPRSRLAWALLAAVVIAAASIGGYVVTRPATQIVELPPQLKVEPVEPTPVEPTPVVQPDPPVETPDAEPDPEVETASALTTPKRPVKPVLLSKEMIARGVRSGSARVSSCFERFRTDLKSAAGQVQVHFVIDLTGTATDVSLLNTELAGTQLEKCVLREVGRFHFPRNLGPPRSIKVPFSYSSHAD